MTFRVLDCDHVFDALTRGPFSGESDADALVDAHLATCPECRRLAESLRPAVGLLHESLSDNADLPSYEGSLPPVDEQSITAVMVKVKQVERPAATPKSVAASPRRVDPMSVVLAGVVGLILGVLIASPGKQFERPRSPLHVLNHPDAAGVSLLEDLNLAGACRIPHAQPLQTPTGDTGMPPHDLAVANYACCTQCHSVEQTHGTFFKHRKSITKLLQGCQACHKAV